MKVSCALLSKGRALVAREMRASELDGPHGLLQVLAKLGKELIEQKDLRKKPRWIGYPECGSKGRTFPHPPYQMKPTELVQLHFFEPAIAVSKVPGSKGIRPHICVGLESVGRVCRPPSAPSWTTACHPVPETYVGV